jgi:hypothetical protein
MPDNLFWLLHSSTDAVVRFISASPTRKALIPGRNSPYLLLKAAKYDFGLLRFLSMSVDNLIATIRVLTSPLV